MSIKSSYKEMKVNEFFEINKNLILLKNEKHIREMQNYCNIVESLQMLCKCFANALQMLCYVLIVSVRKY